MIGKRIKYFRKRKNLTQKELGILVGFPENSAGIRIAQYIIMGIIGAGAIGAWYYLKMVKGKKEDFLDEDDEEDDEEEYYESDDEDSEGGGEDDFFKMDDDDVIPGAPVEDAEMDVADTIDEEEE